MWFIFPEGNVFGMSFFSLFNIIPGHFLVANLIITLDSSHDQYGVCCVSSDTRGHGLPGLFQIPKSELKETTRCGFLDAFQGVGDPDGYQSGP